MQAYAQNAQAKGTFGSQSWKQVYPDMPRSACAREPVMALLPALGRGPGEMGGYRRGAGL